MITMIKRGGHSVYFVAALGRRNRLRIKAPSQSGLLFRASRVTSAGQNYLFRCIKSRDFRLRIRGIERSPRQEPRAKYGKSTRSFARIHTLLPPIHTILLFGLSVTHSK